VPSASPYAPTPTPYSPAPIYAPTPHNQPLAPGFSAPMVPMHPAPPPREGLNAATIVLIVLGFIVLLFLGSCMACSMCVGAAG
jgi:hypothetical protein